jgi:hypothetical protein
LSNIVVTIGIEQRKFCPEYGIKIRITEEVYTLKASYLDGDYLYKHGKKTSGWNCQVKG